MKLFLASGNAHKAQELQGLADAAALPIEIVSARAVGGMCVEFARVTAERPDRYDDAVREVTALYLHLLGVPKGAAP